MDNEEPVNQLLYLPTLAPAWHTFTRRTDMERWLLDRQQALFSPSASDPLATTTARPRTRRHGMRTRTTRWPTRRSTVSSRGI
ncbi:hypothetical protein [Pseudomonas libanensis]|uniref:hypothetical protein n=1 Tax=Pseudomonas libanensis TaxID=75588 RepID=UPI0019104331|nr:hypothetical protein [Pseudomonas libanensis]